MLHFKSPRSDITACNNTITTSSLARGPTTTQVLVKKYLILLYEVSRGCTRQSLYSTVHCNIPNCTVLYCNVMYCTVEYGTELYSNVLKSEKMYCTVIYCTVLYCTVLYYTVLFFTVLYCTL